ncbi:hypothetical protein QQX13_07360 [Demequina sp. SYSU T00068]|uniref:hypothetical protein n=1 Tax=Demequina lignilytica TaxID=3051663 RepID=UPI0026284171|nr:hypothetical protein [Demequina sp. SYSU T00068]MDN4490647.1 hypothetical protein [Demequina sp. SYSU T00068]
MSVLGAISERKNIVLVAHAIASLPIAATVTLLIAGKFDDYARAQVGDIRNLAADSGFRLDVVDRVLEESELDAMIRASSCVVIAHSNNGPSGLFGKCLVAGTPIVAAGARSLRRDAREAGRSRATWTKLEASHIGDGIAIAIGRPRPTPGHVSSDFTDTLLR